MSWSPKYPEQDHKTWLQLFSRQAIYIEGFVQAEDFFKMLSEKKFPVGRFIRNSKDLSYLKMEYA